ncbi:MAG: hypothetical protein KAG10_03290 [Methylococcales bacterium]|nr:hypothetical protein [Methylococcales bacterium]MCK5924896.1 hypothetical protein [Methylococcales bacterium]
MALLKNILLALSLSTALLAVAPSAMAKPAGKIENQTPAQTSEAIDKAIVQAEKTLAALEASKEGDDIKVLLAEFKTTKQIAKTNESATTYSRREKALGKLGKARLAYKKGKKEESVVLMKKSVEIFKEIKVAYNKFMNP